MRGTKFVSALLSAVCVTASAAAADRCTRSDAVRSLKIAELQEQLMVAALTCHDVREYNRFVLSYRPVLQQSDHAMLRFFMRQDGAGAGDRAYNAFKTRLANVSALNSNTDNAAFCGAAADAFNTAFEGRLSLAELAMSEPSYVALPIAGCSDAVVTADVAPSPAEPVAGRGATRAALPKEATSDEDTNSRRDDDEDDTSARQARAGYDMPDRIYRDGPPPPDGVHRRGHDDDWNDRSDDE